MKQTRLLLAVAAIAIAGVTASAAPPMNGHWGYPGNISQHLQQHHGISTFGMTHEQMLRAHDRIHESGMHQTKQTNRSIRLFRLFRNR